MFTWSSKISCYPMKFKRADETKGRSLVGTPGTIRTMIPFFSGFSQFSKRSYVNWTSNLHHLLNSSILSGSFKTSTDQPFPTASLCNLPSLGNPSTNKHCSDWGKTVLESLVQNLIDDLIQSLVRATRVNRVGVQISAKYINSY